MIPRRTFLAAMAAALTIDPERLLWVPGRKTVSIPAPRLLSANEIVVLMNKKLHEMFPVELPDYRRMTQGQIIDYRHRQWNEPEYSGQLPDWAAGILREDWPLEMDREFCGVAA